MAYPATHGVPDEEFMRGKAPMTKEEVRTVSLAKLGLTEDSVCCDVGAGTGSVAVEMALRAIKGKVFAVEKKEDALALLKENKKKFAVPNKMCIRDSFWRDHQRKETNVRHTLKHMGVRLKIRQ